MTFRRAHVSVYGGPDVLRIENARLDDLPSLDPDSVRIRIEASGIAFADLLMREGLYPSGPTPPYTPGYDLVGMVTAVGANVTTLSEGDRVAALTIWGANADIITLPAADVVLAPKDVDAGEAVSLVLNYVTAYQMLHRIARVQPGERILVHGGAGGVGTALLQLGHLADLTMYATASKSKHDLVEQLGATPIDYHKVDFVSFVQSHAGGGMDAVFDPIGGYHVLRSQQTLRKGGRLVSYGAGGTLKDGRPQSWLKRFGTFIGIGLSLASKLLRHRDAALYVITEVRKEHPDWFREDLMTLFKLLQEGKIAPVIGERLPLEDIAKAHELLGASAVRGKIVLEMDATKA